MPPTDTPPRLLILRHAPLAALMAVVVPEVVHALATAAMPHAWQQAEGERAALELFCLEKAAYEITYEAENRPSWLAVPLHGLHGFSVQGCPYLP